MTRLRTAAVPAFFGAMTIRSIRLHTPGSAGEFHVGAARASSVLAVATRLEHARAPPHRHGLDREATMTREVPRFTRPALIVLVLLLGLAPRVPAATVRSGFAEPQGASGLLSPAHMAFAPGRRPFVS